MRSVFTTIALVFFLLAHQDFYGQSVPPSNLTGESLKNWLKANYYDGKHQTLSYSTARRYIYNFIDNKNNTIVCVYSGYVKSWDFGGTGTNPSPINCEHTVPQSFFNEASPMRSDIHHLFPTYQNWNSTRSNHPFGEINDSQTTKWMRGTSDQSNIPSSSIDEYSESSGSVFEPREDHKGNVARAIFYFYTMYPTQAGDISRIGDLDVFYQWHLQDPVDAAEQARNEAIEQYQGSRNPYVDYPELVARAWGFSGGGGTPPGPGPDPVAYCSAQGNSVADEWIQSITIGTYNRNSGADGGYADFTSSTINLNKGTNYSVSLSPGFAGSAYNEYWRIWVDLNQDQDFDDAGELVFDAGNLSSNTVTGSFQLPSSATNGTTRLRIAMKYNGAATACEAFSYGEVEDYTVNIGTGSSTPTPPTPPTPPTAPTYCSTQGSNSTYEWIDQVTLSGINRSSGNDDGYINNNDAANLTAGYNYTIAYSAAFSSSAYTEYWKIWIDWNQDGDFDDAGELVGSQVSSSDGTLTSNFSVPSSAASGQTKMRISMSDSDQGACSTFNYGEVEDYVVNVSGGSARVATVEEVASTAEALEGEALAGVEVFPNPAIAATTATFHTETAQEVIIRLVDVRGNIVWSHTQYFTAGNHKQAIETSSLEKGLYVIQIQYNGQVAQRKLVVQP